MSGLQAVRAARAWTIAALAILVLAACSSIDVPDHRRGASPGRGRGARHRHGQGRAAPAAVGDRQCRPARQGHAERRRPRAPRIPERQHPDPGQGRPRHAGRRPAGRERGARRGRGADPRAALRPVGGGGRLGRQAGQRADDRLLDRFDDRVAGRLPDELPAAERRRPHRQLRRGQGKRSIAALLPDNAYGTVVEAALQRVVGNAGGRVAVSSATISTAPPCRRRRRRSPPWSSRARSNAVFMPDGGDAAPSSPRSSPPTASTRQRSSISAAASGTTRGSLAESNLAGGWFPGARHDRLPGLRGALQGGLRRDAAPQRHARL